MSASVCVRKSTFALEIKRFAGNLQTVDFGGGLGIRTLGRLTPTRNFEFRTIDLSDNPPYEIDSLR